MPFLTGSPQPCAPLSTHSATGTGFLSISVKEGHDTSWVKEQKGERGPRNISQLLSRDPGSKREVREEGKEFPTARQTNPAFPFLDACQSQTSLGKLDSSCRLLHLKGGKKWILMMQPILSETFLPNS